MSVTLILGDCLQEMKKLDDNSVDMIFTDPPYELGFMGKSWDSTGIAFSPDTWRACLRVLKPGGHMLCFGGSRTFHRIAVAIEDAGFELRDTVMWVYGSGFPKSHDVSKAIDKAAGAEREIVGSYTVGGTAAKGKHKGRAAASADEGSAVGCTKDLDLTAPATDAAKQWQGWGTALKPAFEPIILARKPVEGTVAGNVLKWGTGAINVDGCRVAGIDALEGRSRHGGGMMQGSSWQMPDSQSNMPSGRWPANFIHDGSEEVLELMPETGPAKRCDRGKGIDGRTFKLASGELHGIRGHDDSGGSAARFFYCAKASKQDRDEGCEGNHHPTVKPTSLMRYLCHLITPPNGTILDPFTGSGSTGKAAMLEGFKFIGIEREAEYIEIARARINHAGAGDVADQVILGRCEDVRLPLLE